MRHLRKFHSARIFEHNQIWWFGPQLNNPLRAGNTARLVDRLIQTGTVVSQLKGGVR